MDPLLVAAYSSTASRRASKTLKAEDAFYNRHGGRVLRRAFPAASAVAVECPTPPHAARSIKTSRSVARFGIGVSLLPSYEGVGACGWSSFLSFRSRHSAAGMGSSSRPALCRVSFTF